MQRRTFIAILVCVLIAASTTARAVYYPELIDLADPLNATTVAVHGAASEAFAGYAVAGGDINGDGFDDMVVGAYRASGGRGVTYVLFGSATGFDTAPIDLADAEGVVAITGKNVLDWSGSALAVGDINNDSRDDIIIGAYRRDPAGRINAGEVYVVMGASNFHSRGTIDLAATASGVVTISGDDNEDNAGYAVAAGDVNGDNYDDVIIGAHRADPLSRIDGGEAYVIFGTSNFSNRGTIDLNASPSGVLRIYGEDTSDVFGSSAASADIDNDGDCEIILGASNADDNRGAVYVIPGSAALTSQATLDVADEIVDMTVVYGIGSTDHFGDGVTTGNPDGDAFDDVILNIPRAGQDGGFDKGKAIVLFGSAAFGSIGRIAMQAFPSANLSVFYWQTPESGWRSVSAGDLNGDGYDELVIGIENTSPVSRSGAGETIVIYGSADIDSKYYFDMNGDVEGSARIIGGNTGDGTGGAVATLDYDGDGVDDLVVGAPEADHAERSHAGTIRVLKGYDTTDFVSTSPRVGAYANRNEPVEAIFNTDMGSYDVVVRENGFQVTADSLYTGPHSLRYTGWRAFNPGRDISVSVDGENALGEPVSLSWNFHIKDDETPPYIHEHTPIFDEMNVARDEAIVISFSPDIDPDSTTVIVEGSIEGEFTTVKSWSDSVLTLTHGSVFRLSEVITVTVDAVDEYGDRGEPVSWSFSVRPEMTPPWFTVTVPGATGYIPPDAPIKITFPADVDKPTVSTELEGTLTGIVPGEWLWSATTYTFTPSQPYAPGESLVLVAGASDIHRNATGDSMFTFLVKPDIIAPSVLTRSPAAGAANVPVTEDVSIEFTQDIHPDSTMITVTSARKGAIACTTDWVDYTAVLSHTALFAASDTITVNVDAGDEYGNRAALTWSFRTRPDEEPPRFTLLSPANPSVVSKAEAIVLAFPPDVDIPSVEVSLTGNFAGQIPGAWSWTDTIYRFTHMTPFTPGDSMTLIVSAEDIYGNALIDSTVVMYVRPDEIPPSILGRSPASGAVNVALDAPVDVVFSIDASQDSTKFAMRSAEKGAIPFTVAWSGSNVTLNHSVKFALSDTVTVTVSACDAYANRQEYIWQFRTRADSTPPYVTVQVPGNPQLMNSHDSITLTFPADIDRPTVTVAITDDGGSTVNGNLSWADSVYTFMPVPSFPPGTTITCRINAVDIYGNAMPETVRQFVIKPEEIPPVLLGHSPAAGALNVPPGTPLVIHFNRDVYSDSTLVTLFSDQRTSISASRVWSDSTLTVTPYQQWRTDESVTVVLNASDRYGNRLHYNWMFGSGTSVTSSYYYIIVPGERTGIARNAVFPIEFSDRVNISTAQASFSGSVSGALAGTRTWSGNVLTFAPTGFMTAGETITITVTGNDTYGAGIPVSPETVTVGLHTPWVSITGVSFADSADMAHRIDFTTGDPDGSLTLTRNWQYRIGTGEWTGISADRIDQNTNRPPGSYTLLWRPATALQGVYTADMYMRMEAYDGRYTSGPSPSNPFLFDWNRPPAVSIGSATVDYANENVSFTFVITDAEQDSVSLAYEYSTDGGMTWAAGAPDSSLTKLGPGSYSGKFGWNYPDGLNPGIDYTDFRARIIPSDYKSGIPTQSAAINVDLNGPPSAVIDDLYTPQTGDVTLTYHLTDAEHDTLDIACFYSTDGGATWAESDHVTGTSSITQYNGTLIWSSKEDVPSIESFDIRFRIVPSDDDVGTAAISEPFQLINNSPPSIAFALPDTASNMVRIPVMLDDIEGDPVTIHAVWKAAGESEWRPATMRSNLSGLQPSAPVDTLLWDTRDDTGDAVVSRAVLKLIATDAHNGIGDSSTRSALDSLYIDNQPPRIVEVTGYATRDSVYVRYSEPVTVAAAEAARYSLAPDPGIASVLRASADRYVILLGNGLPRTTQVILTVDGITDNRGNIADRLTASFGPKDDNADPRVALGTFPDELTGDVTVNYTITDPEGDTVSLAAEYSLDGGLTWHIASLSGTTSGIGPGGYHGSFVWRSAADAPGTDNEDARLRVTATDSQTGEPAVSVPFRLDNNLPPSITIGVPDPDGVYGGQVSVSYAVDEPEQDYAAFDVVYSLDGGATFEPASLNTQGFVVGPGTYSGTIVWDTDSDLPDSFARVLLVARPYDIDPGIPDSLLVWVDNYGACRATVTMPQGEQTGDVAVQFQVTDPNMGAVSLRSEYSTDGGGTWRSAVIEGGGHIGPGAYTGQLLWRSSTDLSGFEGIAQLKVIPDNGIEGMYAIGTVALDYNQPPQVTIDPPGAEVSGDAGFVCRITDEEHDPVTIDMEFSIDGGQNWYEAGMRDNTGVPGDGSPHTVIWESMNDLPNRETQNLTMRFLARDLDPGEWTALGPLHLDNNLPPIIAISMDYPDSVRTEYADITYHIEDDERNMVSLTASYSADGGQSFAPATLTGDVTGIFSGGYDGTVRWELDDDMPAGSGTAILKLLASDEDAGPADSLMVRYNTFGVCTVALTAPVDEQEGDVAIEYSITDKKGNPVDLAVEYSINKFGIWLPAMATGALTGIGQSGYDGSFTWVATQDAAGFQGMAKLRITPDNGGGGEAAIIEFPVDNNSPPAIVSVTLDTEHELAGNVLIAYRGSDAENDPIAASLVFSLDGGSTFLPATTTGGAAVRPGVSGLVAWQSFGDIGHIWQQEVHLALIPSDGDPGEAFGAGPVTVTNMAGDFNFDLRIDGNDLPLFADAWNNQDVTRDVGPVTGTPPELVPDPDGRIDFEDLAVFVWMWNWYSGQAAEKSSYGSDAVPAKPAAGREDAVLVTPDGRGFLHIDAAKPLDYFRIATASASDVTMTMTSTGYWDSGHDGIILTRAYQDGSAELAAVRFGEPEQVSGASAGLIRIEGCTGDVAMEFTWREAGQEAIQSRSMLVAREDLAVVPSAYELARNMPNPFNPSTTISYSLPVDSRVRLIIYSSAGQLVKELFDERMPAGVHSVVWDATGMPSGLYFYRIIAGSFRETRKMLLLK